MKLPELTDYQQAIQAPHLAFTDEQLRRGAPRLTPLGLPTVASGGFALTFDIAVNGRHFAVRCFHKEGNHLQERYARIAEFVRANAAFDFLVDVDYLPAGVQVNGNHYPIVRMPWIDSTPLNYWVEDNLHSPQALENVRQQVSRAAAELRGAGAAHGDLQHGNILVRADNTIRLVDYDGMYLPRLCRLGAPEQGHRHYQHPRRGDSFDDTIDAFPAAVIDLSLAALQRHPELWHQHYNEDNLLLTASDFAAPEQSELFARLCRLEPVAERAERLKRACTTEFSFVSDVLGGSRVHHPAVGGSLRSPNALPVIRATQPDTLRARQGDNVTVFGRVTSTKVHPTRGNRALVNINFGDYRKADFTIVAFDSACAELQERFGAELAGLNRRWVSLTGLVELYQSRWSTNLTPQIHLGRARALRLLDEAQVEALRSAADSPNSADDSDAVEPGWSAVTKTTTRRQGNPPASPEPRRSSRPAEAEDVETRLSQLYSSPRFASRTPPGYSGTNGPPAVGGNGRTAAQGPSSQRSSSTPSPPPPATPPPPPGLSAPKPPAGTSPTSPASGTPLHGDAFRADSRRGQGALRRFLRMLRRK